MNRTKGFTIIELLVVVAIIVILAVVVASYPRKAGAHDLTPTSVATILNRAEANYQWQADGHQLTIFDRGTANWADAQAVCNALKRTVKHLHVTMLSRTSTGELRWEGEAPERTKDTGASFGTDPELTNLPTISTAEC